MKKVLCTVGVIIMCFTSKTIKAYDPPVIMETEKIIPDPVILLQDEVRSTPNWDKDCSDTTIQISYDDAQILMRIAAAEAADQGITGMEKVMQVVWNRVNSDDYPNTIQKVVFQKNQFETVSKGTYWTVDIPVNAHLALAEFEKNQNHDDEIIAFEATWNDSALLRYYDVAYIYEGHTFYQIKKD